MIETIYKSEENKNGKPDINIRLPKNIKQIGQSDADMSCQIYIEENVLSYIKQKTSNDNQVRYGVLLGDKKQGNGYTYIFINGMVEVEEVIEDSIIFSDDVWTGIYDNIRRYYKEGMIVGWYASFNYDVTKDMLSIRKIHIDHFAGNNKVFLNINRDEDDEAFYIYERNGLDKQPCYHVYFEKSSDFEDYIFGTGRKDSSIRAKETATKETGKYGIVLNNNNGGAKENSVLGKISKEGEKLTNSRLGRVASFVTIVALAGTLGIMWQNGGLDGLQTKLKGLVDGIIHSEENEPDMGNIIAVDGNPTQQNTTISSGETVDANARESSQAENTSSESGTSLEQSSSLEEESTTSSENTSSQKSASEDETTTLTSQMSTEEATTTANTHATISDTNSIYATYIVKNGETLYSIAMSFYGTPDMIDDIMELNNMTDENYVMEGQKILLP